MTFRMFSPLLFAHCYTMCMEFFKTRPIPRFMVPFTFDSYPIRINPIYFLTWITFQCNNRKSFENPAASRPWVMR